jgi:hypothetical protein
MIVEILIPQRKAVNPLRHQRVYAVLDTVWIAVIGEAASQSMQQTDALIDFSQQQSTTVRRQPATVKTANYISAS